MAKMIMMMIMVVLVAEQVRPVLARQTDRRQVGQVQKKNVFRVLKETKEQEKKSFG